MLNKQIFILAHEIGSPSFYKVYRELSKNQWSPYEVLKHQQEKKLRGIISYSYEQVPYYRTLFRKLDLHPHDIRTLEDLEKIPIITKKIIKDHWEEFKPVNLSSISYINDATGGSTGTPFEYRLSNHARFLGGALLYRGWGYNGYELGDPMVFLAGSSLGVGTKSWLVKRGHEIARNLKKLSSFDMGENEMREYVREINTFKPKFIRGYASSIYFFSKWIEKKDLNIHSPKAIFTTSEKLFPIMRSKISETFGCEVFDGYGLNDGGVSAYECPEHNGLHIDTERSVMEVVDKDGFQIEEGEGQILATSLHNYAMPFIRYATDDIASIKDDICGCGRQYKLLKEIVGRTVDNFITPDGIIVHGWFFLYIFWDYGKGIKEYQVVQKTVEELYIYLVIEEDFDEIQLQSIKKIIESKGHGWKIQFRIVDSIDRTRTGKYKFIINEILTK